MLENLVLVVLLIQFYQFAKWARMRLVSLTDSLKHTERDIIDYCVDTRIESRNSVDTYALAVGAAVAESRREMQDIVCGFQLESMSAIANMENFMGQFRQAVSSQVASAKTTATQAADIVHQKHASATAFLMRSLRRELALTIDYERIRARRHDIAGVYYDFSRYMDPIEIAEMRSWFINSLPEITQPIFDWIVESLFVCRYRANNADQIMHRGFCVAHGNWNCGGCPSRNQWGTLSVSGSTVYPVPSSPPKVLQAEFREGVWRVINSPPTLGWKMFTFQSSRKHSRPNTSGGQNEGCLHTNKLGSTLTTKQATAIFDEAFPNGEMPTALAPVLRLTMPISDAMLFMPGLIQRMFR